MCFFFYVSRHFFSPNLRGRAEKKQNAQRKKKHWLSVPDYLTDKWHTELIVLSAVILVYFLPNNDRVIQLPLAAPWKFDFSWYLASLRGQRTRSNLQPKRSSTLRMHSSCRDRSLDGKLDRGLDSRPNTYPDVFCQSKTSLLSAESTFDDFNRKDLGFWFSVTRQCNSLASA